MPLFFCFIFLSIPIIITLLPHSFLFAVFLPFLSAFFLLLIYLPSFDFRSSSPFPLSIDHSIKQHSVNQPSKPIFRWCQTMGHQGPSTGQLLATPSPSTSPPSFLFMFSLLIPFHSNFSVPFLHYSFLDFPLIPLSSLPGLTPPLPVLPYTLLPWISQSVNQSISLHGQFIHQIELIQWSPPDYLY